MNRSITVLLAVAPLVLGLATGSQAQDGVAECRDCVIGIFDDPNLSQNYGFWDVSLGPLKSVYVGIQYPSGSAINGLTGFELSIDGIPASTVVPAFRGLPDPTVVIGTDIRTPNGNPNGGISMAWADCVPGNRALVRVDMIRFEPVPNDVVLTIHPRFPQSDPNVKAPLFTQCDGPIFTRTLVSTQCYVINPTIHPWPCTTGIEPSTWTRVKSLFRD